jgi:hypothetical protein
MKTLQSMTQLRRDDPRNKETLQRLVMAWNARHKDTKGVVAPVEAGTTKEPVK